VYLFSHREKRYTSHHPKQLQSLRQVKYYFPKYLLFKEYNTSHAFTYLPSAPALLSNKHGDHGAATPLSKIMPKHDEDMGGISKKNIGR
jgi:hypothetical protein